MSDAMRELLDRRDVDGVRALLEADPGQAHDEIVWGPNGKNVVPPLHYVCDVVFRGAADQATGRALGRLLLDAGVDPNLAYARSGDTFLIAAASLRAEDLGLLLVDEGADVHARGLFGATALHWSANGGLPRLAERLLDAGADLHLADAEHGATPLGWAVHAWLQDRRDDRPGVAAAAGLLRARGAAVPEGAAEELEGPAHAPLREALGLA